MIVTGLVFFVIVFSMATNLMPFHLAAVIGAIVVILARCISVKEALDSFSMPTLFLVAGIFPLSSALVKTGAAQAIVTFLAGQVVGVHPFIAIAFTPLLLHSYAICRTLLDAIMTPIGILLRNRFNRSAGVVMCIALTASVAF